MFLYQNYDEQNYNVNWRVYQLLHGLQLKNVTNTITYEPQNKKCGTYQMFSTLLLMQKAVDYIRETGSLLAYLCIPKTNQVWKYFLHYVTKRWIRSKNELEVDQK